MNDLANLLITLINWVKQNYKKPKLWITLVVVVVLVYWLIPYIDSNFFYYDRMEKRISILQQLTELDQGKISTNTILKNEYQDILNDIQIQEERMVSSIITNISNSINRFFEVKPQEGKIWLKFMSGAAVSLIIAVFIPGMNTFSSKKQKIAGFILVLVIAVILGEIGVMLPIIIDPKVNYFGIPILQLIGLITLIVKSNKTEKKKEIQK